MYEFFNRFISLDILKEDVIDFFGCIPDTEGLSVDERENMLVDFFRKRLKKIADRQNTHLLCSDIQILHPHSDRTKYYLIYLSSHPKGIIVFSDVAEKCEYFQHRIRVQTKLRRKTERTGQLDMFADTPPVEQQKNKNNDLNIIQNLWLQMIDEEGRAFNNKDLALLIESHGFYPSQIQQALGILIKEGLVENMDDKTGKRRKNFIHFEKNERLRRIE